VSFVRSRRYQQLQIQAGAGFDASGRDCMQVAFAQHDEIGAAHFDLIAILRAEQNAIADLGAAHVLTECNDLGPHQTLRDLRSRWDQDATGGPALAIALRNPHQQPIIEHLDWKLLIIQRHLGRVPSVISRFPTEQEGKCIVRYRSAVGIAFGFCLLAIGAACTDDAGEATQPGDATSTSIDPASGQTTTLPLDIPTTFIENCSQMPSAPALSGIVGIPLADGQVVGAGTCQFLGLNEQSRVITLALLTDIGDQTIFNDLQVSLGPSTPLTDPTLVNAFVDPTSLVYINANGSIYTVRTLITDATPAEQVPLSVAVLHVWLNI